MNIDLCKMVDLLKITDNLIAATAWELSLRETAGDAAIHVTLNQAYNNEVDDRTSPKDFYSQIKINLLPLYPHTQAAQPSCCNFRPGDVHQSLTEIRKAKRLLYYAPPHRIGQELKLVMPWYVDHRGTTD